MLTGQWFVLSRNYYLWERQGPKIKAPDARATRIQKIRKVVNTHVIFVLLTTWDLLRSDGRIFDQ